MDGTRHRVCALGSGTGGPSRCPRHQGRGNAADQYAPRAGSFAKRFTVLTSAGMDHSILMLRNPKQTWAPPGGYPKLKPRPGRAADFIADTIRANPGEVVLYCAGPLTNIALRHPHGSGDCAAHQVHLHHGWKQRRRPGTELVVGPGSGGHRAARSLEGDRGDAI